MLLFQILFLVSFMATQSKATVIQCKPLCTKDLQLMNYTVNSLESKARRFDLLTGKMDIFSLRATSGGYVDGNVCSIQINNGPNLVVKTGIKRGYNIRAFDPYSGQALQRHYDTHKSTIEKNKMMKFLKEEVQFGMVVIMSVLDEASKNANFSEEDEHFMATLGIFGDACPLKIGFRDSFAIITAKTLTGVPPPWYKCKHAAIHQGTVDVEVRFD